MKIVIQRKSHCVEYGKNNKDGWVTEYQFSSTNSDDIKVENWRILAIDKEAAENENQ